MEPSHMMKTYEPITRQFSDEELRRRADELVSARQPAMTQGHTAAGQRGQYADEDALNAWRDGRELGVVLWRLLERSTKPRDASGRTTQESLQGAVDYLVDDLLRPLGGVVDGAALTVPHLMLLMDDLKAHVLELRSENAELASLRELVEQKDELLAGYRKALTSVTDDPPHNGTATSKAAAKSVRPIVNPMRMKVLRELQASAERGLTADAIEVHTGMTGNSIRPRLGEMEILGWVMRRDGDVRATRSGREASVWYITSDGAEAFTKAAHEASTKSA